MYPYLSEFRHFRSELVEDGVIWGVDGRFALQQSNLLLLLLLLLDRLE